MKIAFFETHDWERPLLKKNLNGHGLVFFENELNENNVKEVSDCEVISVFVYSKLDKKIINKLKKTKAIVTRSTGFDHIDLKECKKKKIKIYNVPSYGENTVAEHAFALLLSLSRKIHKSYLKMLKHDHSIDGLKGFDLKGKTIGVIGAGKIGKHVIRIAQGFEMSVLVCDRHEDDFLAEQLDFKYVSLNNLLKNSDVVSLHVPYSKGNHHMINKKTLALMKKGSILINTARGALVDTTALISALDNKHLYGAGIDVVEGEEFIQEEKQLIYDAKRIEALKQVTEDHVLMNRYDVIYTPHIAFFSQEALERIIHTTVENIKSFISGRAENLVCE